MSEWKKSVCDSRGGFFGRSRGGKLCRDITEWLSRQPQPVYVRAVQIRFGLTWFVALSALRWLKQEGLVSEVEGRWAKV